MKYRGPWENFPPRVRGGVLRVGDGLALQYLETRRTVQWHLISPHFAVEVVARRVGFWIAVTRRPPRAGSTSVTAQLFSGSRGGKSCYRLRALDFQQGVLVSSLRWLAGWKKKIYRVFYLPLV